MIFARSDFVGMACFLHRWANRKPVPIRPTRQWWSLSQSFPSSCFLKVSLKFLRTSLLWFRRNIWQSQNNYSLGFEKDNYEHTHRSHRFSPSPLGRFWKILKLFENFGRKFRPLRGCERNVAQRVPQSTSTNRGARSDHRAFAKANWRGYSWSKEGERTAWIEQTCAANGVDRLQAHKERCSVWILS